MAVRDVASPSGSGERRARHRRSRRLPPRRGNAARTSAGWGLLHKLLSSASASPRRHERGCPHAAGVVRSGIAPSSGRDGEASSEFKVWTAWR
jgi:hypothetical protein